MNLAVQKTSYMYSILHEAFKNFLITYRLTYKMVIKWFQFLHGNCYHENMEKHPIL